MQQTTNPDDFAACAMMMFGSDPWITDGMDYYYCLKVFEGPFKEVFVPKKEKEIIGFVVMQPQGTFKGYIQTIAIKIVGELKDFVKEGLTELLLLKTVGVIE